MKGKTGRKTFILISLMLSVQLVLGGCQLSNRVIDSMIGRTSVSETTQAAQPQTDPSGTTSGFSFFVDHDSGLVAEPYATEAEGEIREFDEALRQNIDKLLAAGFADFEDQIELTEAIVDYEVSEEQIDSLVSLIVKIFEQQYMQNPFLFYLDGAMKVGYELQSGWGQRRLIAVNVSFQRLSDYGGLSQAELSQIRESMLVQADQIAGLAAGDRSDWEKLLIVHDELVRSITYDTTLNQHNNQAASALIDGLTLCKGYAQAFKLIADRLGLECQVISGQADGIEHAWNLVVIDQQHFHVDVTHDDPVPDRGGASPVEHRHFLRSDAVMLETHQWNQQAFPVSDMDGAHYYRQNDLVVNNHDEIEQKLQQFLKLVSFDDDRDDQLELLYTGSDLPDDQLFDQMFRQALETVNISRAFSYRLAVSKNVLQLIIITS